MAKRKINQKLVDLIDRRLASHALAQEIMSERDVTRARTLLVIVAQCLVGIREHGGNNRGPEVQLFQDTVGVPQAQFWCMDYDQSVIAYVELKLGIVSPIPATESCSFAWENTPKEQRVKGIPLPGAIAIWSHPKGGGHTGIVEACDGETFFAYEGNTEGGLDSHDKVERDGGGVYHTKRSCKGTPKMKVVGFLKPF